MKVLLKILRLVKKRKNLHLNTDPRCRFGTNEVKKVPIKSIWEMLLAPFEDKIMKILSAAAIISLICGYIQHGTEGLMEGVSIVIAIVIILVVTATNDY